MSIDEITLHQLIDRELEDGHKITFASIAALAGVTVGQLYKFPLIKERILTYRKTNTDRKEPPLLSSPLLLDNSPYLKEQLSSELSIQENFIADKRVQKQIVNWNDWWLNLSELRDIQLPPATLEDYQLDRTFRDWFFGTDNNYRSVLKDCRSYSFYRQYFDDRTPTRTVIETSEIIKSPISAIAVKFFERPFDEFKNYILNNYPENSYEYALIYDLLVNRRHKRHNSERIFAALDLYFSNYLEKFIAAFNELVLPFEESKDWIAGLPYATAREVSAAIACYREQENSPEDFFDIFENRLLTLFESIFWLDFSQALPLLRIKTYFQVFA